MGDSVKAVRAKAPQRPLLLEWAVCPDGYCIERREDEPSADAWYKRQFGGTFIVPASQQFEPLTLEGNIKKPIACDLVNILNAPHDKLTAMRKFACRYGLLTWHREAEVSQFDLAIDELRGAQHVQQFQGVPEVLKQIRRDLSADQPSPDGTCILRKPKNLLLFILCEFVDVLEAGRQFRICAMCSDMFASAIARGKRKEEPRFCGKECRNTWHNKKEGAARRAERDAVRKKVQELEREAERQQGSPGKGDQPTSDAASKPKRWRRVG